VPSSPRAKVDRTPSRQAAELGNRVSLLSRTSICPRSRPALLRARLSRDPRNAGLASHRRQIGQCYGAASGATVIAPRGSRRHDRLWRVVTLPLLPCLAPPARERERASLETCADVSEPALTAWRSPRHGAPGGDPNEYRTCAVRALLPSVHDGTAVGPAPTPGFRTARHRAPCAPSGASQCPRGLTLGDRLPGMGCSSRLPLTGHPSPDTPVSTPQARLQRRRWAGAIGMGGHGPGGWSCIDDDPNSVHRARIRARALAS
jgi:hypothetical protein